ncbi:MAG: hypothetical protein UX12_C0028G0001 [Candidatus Collierbacteria bacterium GW2011_GWC1_45_47]|nr:MAG: hypothetical protein UX12_C0028G0001 [Candidatus Collierbacteria bacterium GW2011_GWC1_45_47]
MKNTTLRRKVEDILRKQDNNRPLYKVAALLGIGCAEHGGHEYADKTCSKCGAVYCYSCCGSQNVDQGGKHSPDYMLCPVCGHDWYAG